MSNEQELRLMSFDFAQTSNIYWFYIFPVG